MKHLCNIPNKVLRKMATPKGLLAVMRMKAEEYLMKSKEYERIQCEIERIKREVASLQAELELVRNKRKADFSKNQAKQEN